MEKKKVDQIAKIEKQLTDNLNEISSINNENHNVSNFQQDKCKKRNEVYLKVLDDLAYKDPIYQPILQKLRKGLKENFKEMD